MTAPVDTLAVARWHAYSRAIEAIAPLTEEAAQAISRAVPADLEYARERARILDQIRNGLVQRAREVSRG